MAARRDTGRASRPEHSAPSYQEVDALLCSLHRVASEIHERVETTRREPSARVVDLAQFESRAFQLDLLRHLHAELGELLATVARYGRTAETIHRAEVEAMKQTITPADASGRGVPWRDRALTARVLGMDDAPRAPSGAGRPAPRPPQNETPRPEAPARPPRAAIQLDEQVTLDAVVVPDALREPRDILAAVAGPDLHYVPQWDHFAVRIGGTVFHGNVGRVIPAGGAAPARVKECRLRGGCAKACAYYHDPAEHAAPRPPRRDVRNFTADSWEYAPPALRHSARPRCRRIGSRDTLAVDLQTITAADARLFVAQATHDILCALLLSKYVLGS